MAQSSDTIRLVELICARLCHDLGGLIGTVANALDMVTEDAGRDNEVLAFASSAAHALTQRLRLMRTAWGPESDAITLPALVKLVSQTLAARRVRLDTDRLQADCEFASPVARVVLNLIVLACDCLPRGGAIVLLGEPADLLVRIVGQGAAWPQGFTECMRDESAALAALTNALSVQMPLTALFAQSGGLRLSPVLGPASGIEALRLSPG
ncbi:MAG TPA: histidine phosphotransferase family protein [Acetobacteraceae bacterium]|nr:histidine phosphotransferase family protein [Acetobacteraceae bacterium]